MIKRTLQELCLNITDGKHGDCENEENSGYYFISCKDIFDGQINYKNARQITKADFEETHKRTMLEVDDILLTNSGTIGRMAFVTDRVATIKTTFQKSVAIIKPDKQKVLPRYLYYQLQNCVPQFINSSNGSAQKNLLLSTMRTFQIEIEENCEKQEKIANTLSAYDDLIENNQKQIKLLEEAAQRLYKEWFVDLRFPGHENTKIVDGMPEGWKKERLVDIAEIQYGYAFDGTLFNADKNGTPIIRIRNIPQAETMDYTTEHVNENYLVQNGEIIVGMDGEFHINAWAGNTAYLVQRVCCIRPKNTEIKGWLLQAIYEPIKFFERTVVGATVAHLGKKHLDSIYLLTSPEEFYEPFKTFFDKRLLLMNQNRKLREARDRLLPKLMSGEVEV
jgi:type I restriction enzyme S subunit